MNAKRPRPLPADRRSEKFAGNIDKTVVEMAYELGFESAILPAAFQGDGRYDHAQYRNMN